MRKNLFPATTLCLMIAFAALTYAQDATPPLTNWRPSTVDQKIEPPANPVTAVLVKSWGNNPVWADLNTNWSTYGTVPVSVDYTSLITSDFTYADLVASGADVIIISDAAGGTQQYTTSEITAVTRYAHEGHSILATYATFEYSTYDNRGLAPIFGLSSSLSYDTVTISNDFDKVKSSCLVNKIPASWRSNGFDLSQVPTSGTWTGNLGGAKAVADADSYAGVITVYPTKTYTGMFVSNMPEYESVGGDDEQLLYNAITCFVKK